MAFLIVLSVAMASVRSAAYVLFDNGATDWVVGSEDALRWDPQVWPLGGTLRWEIEDAPEWNDLFGSSRAFFGVVEEALSDWSEIPTADIQWEAAGFSDADVGRRDSTNQVYLRRPLSTLGRDSANFGGWWTTVHVWFALDTSGARPVWHLTECDVGLDQSRMEEYKDENASDDPDILANFVRGPLGNAFQTCLGLGDSGGYPGSHQIRESERDSFDRQARLDHYYESPWHESAVFSGSYADRSVGASLLRPRSGWLPTVGSVSGSLSVDGEPVAYAQVWALRHQTDGGTGSPIGAYSNRSGEFLIEGLEPGNYLLWAHPARYNRLSTRVPLAGATIDVRDTVLLGAVRIRAGRVTSRISIPMEAGRH
ncbi:MAG: carboxypeptidase-like regulatory domain-containing protein [Gammaproteobacteria bacterium]|nr:carboxypeptidase-like regulatory domain-containing protein [Gammaproteobacteria bacterium]